MQSKLDETDVQMAHILVHGMAELRLSYIELTWMVVSERENGICHPKKIEQIFIFCATKLWPVKAIQKEMVHLNSSWHGILRFTRAYTTMNK